MTNEVKTIWYCHHYAGSPSLGMSYRPYYLTKEFSKAGHNAYVISASFHHLLQKEKQQTKPVEMQTVDDVAFITLKVKKYLGNGLPRLLNMLGYAWGFKRHFKKIAQITGKPDVIIVSSSHPFHFPYLNKLAKRVNAKIIFEVRDLWPLSLLELLKVPQWHPMIRWLARIERQAYQRADAVVSLLKEALPYMKSKGLKEQQFHVIPNGTSCDLFRQAKPLAAQMQKKLNTLLSSGAFLLGYAGAMGKPNALEYLIAAMADAKITDLPIHCIILGDGNLKAQLEQEVIRLGLENVSFFSSIPKYEIPAFLKELDGFYLGWNQVELYKYGVSPNKLFDYMMAGKPIIESGGSPHSLIEEIRCGIRCEAQNPEAIAEAISKLYFTPVEERVAMGKRGIAAIENNFDYKILAKQYIELL
jgi:glycosyltransferase involved in cell wall biosynthesis